MLNPLPLGEGLSARERSERLRERVRVGFRTVSITTVAAAHAAWTSRPSSARFAGTFSHREKGAVWNPSPMITEPWTEMRILVHPRPPDLQPAFAG